MGLVQMTVVFPVIVRVQVSFQYRARSDECSGFTTDFACVRGRGERVEMRG